MLQARGSFQSESYSALAADRRLLPPGAGTVNGALAVVYHARSQHPSIPKRGDCPQWSPDTRNSPASAFGFPASSVSPCRVSYFFGPKEALRRLATFSQGVA